VELRVPAAQLVGAVLVAGGDLGVTHRQRRSSRLHRPEPLAPRLELAKLVEIDLDVEDLLQAAHVRVAPGLVRIDERAAPGDARAGVHDPVAVHLAPPAFDLVLRSQGDFRRRRSDRDELAHDRMVARVDRPAQDLTCDVETGKRVAARASCSGGVRLGGETRVRKPVVRRILFAGLLVGPLTIALHYLADLDETMEFVLAAVALIPLAWLIGEATEHAAEHTGPGIGGFLNATFGNAPELIIALLAVNEGLTEVVRGSLTGSVVGNLLLVLGFSLVAGPRGELDRWSSFMSFAAIGLAIVLFLIPSIPAWEGDPDRDLIVNLSVPISLALLVVYIVSTVYSLRRHRMMHVVTAEATRAWSLRDSLLVLAAATVVTALVAEILVGSLEVFAEEVGLTEFFVAAVIVAIVGNAAEHGGAVVVAYRGKVQLAAEIALASAAQVAVFLIPAVVLLSWLIDPLALGFREVEIAALAFGLAVAAITLWRGRASKARGAILLAAYVIVAIAFYVAGDRDSESEASPKTVGALVSG
jgi:Ca2+:H+ antiporter